MRKFVLLVFASALVLLGFSLQPSLPYQTKGAKTTDFKDIQTAS